MHETITKAQCCIKQYKFWAEVGCVAMDSGVQGPFENEVCNGRFHLTKGNVCVKYT